MTDPILLQLWHDLAAVHAPEGMRSFHGIPQMRFAFFPGASGLWLGEQARVPVGGTLVLGSNFGSVQSHLDGNGELLRQDERHGRTWAPLVQGLHEAGIAAQDCFFTNAWPLLHEAKGNCSGQIHRWLRDEPLMESCLQFFHRTLDLVKPRLLIALGAGPAAFCGHAWPTQLAPWAKASWRAIDPVPFASVDYRGGSAVCVAITHTCRPNWKHRVRFNTHALEVALVREAWLQALNLSVDIAPA